MADEFIKGLTLFTLGGLGWITFGGWYRTPSYYEIDQLVAPPQGVESAYDEIGVLAGDAFLWLMIIGPIVFWVLLPAGRQLRESMANDAAN